MRQYTARPRGENLGDFGPGVRYAAGRQISEAASDREGSSRCDAENSGDKAVSVYLRVSAAFAAIVLVILLTYPIW